MPIGYLPPTLIVAWCTLCAVAPRRWRLASGWVRFRCAMLINELPCLGLYWLLVTTLSTTAQGEIDTPLGWSTLALGGLTVAGLVVILARQQRTGATFGAAFDTGLGGVWRPGRRHEASLLRHVRLVLAPSRSRRRDVERIADVPYGEAGRANTLDLYRSRSAREHRFVLIHLHGGQLRSGRKNHEGLPLIYGLAERGWLCISANYRLFPDAQFPDPLIDVKKVVAWVRSHAAEYGADANAVFVAGGSSGAQLAALTALTANQPMYQPGFERVDTAVCGAVTLYGMYGRHSVPGIDPRSDDLPAVHVHADAPPFLVVHGTADSVLSVEGARHFATELRRVSAAAVVYAELPGAQHSFDLFRSLRSAPLIDAVESFADATWREQPRPLPPISRRY